MVHSLTIGLPVNVMPFTLYRHYPEKKYILGIPHLRPCATLSDSRPSISGVIITKKVRYHGEKIGSTFPSSCISPTETGHFRLGLLAFARSYTHVPTSCRIAMQW